MSHIPGKCLFQLFRLLDFSPCQRAQVQLLSRNVSQAMAWVQAADQTAGYVSWTILESQDWNRNVFDERGKERERWRINVKRSSPPFPASKIVTKVNKVPICTFAQIGSQFDLCPSRGETAPKQCSWSLLLLFTDPENAFGFWLSLLWKFTSSWIFSFSQYFGSKRFHGKSFSHSYAGSLEPNH